MIKSHGFFLFTPFSILIYLILLFCPEFSIKFNKNVTNYTHNNNKYLLDLLL